MRHRAILVVITVSCCVACVGNGDPVTVKDTRGLPPAGSVQTGFVPLPPHAALARIKNLLVASAPTAAEYAAYDADPNALDVLVTTWQTLPQYQLKMIRFLSNAFQQSQVTTASFANQGLTLGCTFCSPLVVGDNALLINLQESFARTVLELDAQGRPFTEAFTTRNLMVTTGVAFALAFADMINPPDQNRDAIKMENDAYTFLYAADPNEFPKTYLNFIPQDLTDWHMISTAPPPNGGDITNYNNLVYLRSATSLALKVPRIGFFSTMAFQAGWPTNASNSARVTANQALIVALGQSIDGSHAMRPSSLASVDLNHADPSSACFSCHQDLDPLRQFFRQSFTLFDGVQQDPNEMSLPGEFALNGVDVKGTTGIVDLANIFANHPDMPVAWVRKICEYANDSPCDPADPEIERLAQAFVAGNYSFSALVHGVFTSPLVTLQSPTISTANLELPITKQDHLCPLLSARLGIVDVCGLTVGANPNGALQTVRAIARALPANGYSRGQVEPFFANDPSLFFRSGVEGLCASVASRVVGTASNSLWNPNDPNNAISDMATRLMGLAPDDAGPVSDILRQHYNSALATGVSSQDAMLSTFTVACSSPMVVGIGL